MTTKPTIILYAHLDRDRDGGYSHLNFFASDESGRHFSDSDAEKLGWLRLDDFCVSNQMGGHGSPDSDYAWNVCYLRPYTVGWRDAKEMFKTLDRISRGSDKLSSKVGHPTTYGQFVARVATVLGATIRIYHEDDRSHWNNYLPGNAVSAIDRIVREEIDRLKGKVAA